MTEQSHEAMIHLITEEQFNQTPQYIDRIVIGICNEVYRVGLKEREVIARLSPHDRFLMGSHDHIPKFKALGIPVPDILSEDYSKNLVPYAYQILSKIEGEDLGQVIETLSDQQLRDLAKEVANIFKKVGTIPSSDKFGVVRHEAILRSCLPNRRRLFLLQNKPRALNKVASSTMQQKALPEIEAVRTISFCQP